MSLDAIDKGWYTEAGTHYAYNENYLVGRNSHTHRNFFVFDLSGVDLSRGQCIVEAALVLDTFEVFTEDASETVEFFDVTAPVTDLLIGLRSVSRYDDFGTGISYGMQTYKPRDPFPPRVIALNSAAVDAIRLSAGSLFAIGGSVTTLQDTPLRLQYVFNGSHIGIGITRLDLTIVPEPPAFAFATSTLFGLSLIRRCGQRLHG
jgi:hypothetical protein